MIIEGSVEPQVKGPLLFLKKIAGSLKLIVKWKILETNKRDYKEVSCGKQYPLPTHKDIPNCSKSNQNIPF